MHRAGLSVEEALLVATAGGAELCGVGDDLGRLEQGFVFDAVVLDGDPGGLSAFAEPGAVTGVFQSGRPVAPAPAARLDLVRPGMNDEPRPRCEVRGVSKRFGGVQALQDIDLASRRGSIHALVGENGAGKSTLGKIIAGVHRPDDGELRVNGAKGSLPLGARRARGRRHADRAGADARPAPVGARERLPRRRGHRRRSGRAAQLTAALRAARRRARHRATRRDGSRALSVSQTSRRSRSCGRSRATPSFVVMDEPTSALTRDEADRLFELVRRLQDGGDDDRLRLAFPGRGARARGHGHRAARREAGPDVRRRRARRPRASSPRCSAARSELRSPRRSRRPPMRRSCSPCATYAAAGRQRSLVRDPRRRDRRAGWADRQRPHPGRPRDLRRRPPRRRHGRGRRVARCALRSPRQAISRASSCCRRTARGRAC